MNKVLILTPHLTLPGGVSNFINLLGGELEKEKYEIQYFFVGKTGLFYKDIFYLFLMFINVIRLKKILIKFNPDIVQINPSLAGTAIFRDFLFLNIIKKKGYPVILFIHGWQMQISNRFKSIIWNNYFRKRFEMADAIIVLANQFKEELLSLGLKDKKVHVSSTMVNSAQYSQSEKNFSKPYTILFCATMKKSKGPYELLNAIPLVIKKYIDTSFIFLGDGKELKKLKTKTKEMGLGKNVTFTGYKTGNEKIDLFKKAHIFVFPSYSEGYPTVVLEAMAAGLPLIITSVGGLVNTIEDGKQGFFIRKSLPDPKEIAEKIVYLIENPYLMKNMSDNNIKEAKQKYDSVIVTKKIIEKYKEICVEKINLNKNEV